MRTPTPRISATRRPRRTALLLRLLTITWVIGLPIPATTLPAVAAAAPKKKGKVKKARKKPPPEKDPAAAKAKEHFARGKMLFASGQFAEALEAYTAAYESKPLPAILFNIAQCHRNLGHHEEAIFFYRKYLLETPETPHRDAVTLVITELEAAAAEAKRLEAERLAAERASAEAAAEAERRASIEAKMAADKAARAAKKPKAWVWVLVGTSVALVGGGVATTIILLNNRVPNTTLGAFDCTGWPASTTCE